MRLPPIRTLDFDCENQPLSYLGGDFTTPGLTAIAWQFVGNRNPICRLLPEDTMAEMLGEFREAVAQADLLTGHNICKHDLPLLNAMLIEQRMAPLPPILVSDTYRDLKKRSPGFASQATLAAMLGVRAPKVGMSTPDWREANRLTPEGIEKTRRRVVGDVRQHVALRKKLHELGWLRAPRLWTP